LLPLRCGACITIDVMGPILPAPAESGGVIAVEMQGHGGTADIDRPIRHERLAQDDSEALEPSTYLFIFRV
jgi:hypothetical protein